MKIRFFIGIFLFPLAMAAQEPDITYEELKSTTVEVQLADSISINNTAWQLNKMDTGTVKKWFSQLLPTINNNRLKNRNYYLAGKITVNDNFDLLLVVEEKKKTDTTLSQVVHLITNKKDGTYIASLEISVTPENKKKSTFITSSWLYKDYKIIQDSKITVNQRSFADLKKYKINPAGRFILYPNY